MRNFAVCVFVNHTCTCGPYLNPRKVALLPTQFGSGSLTRVLREAVQATVDSAFNEKTVFSLIKQGGGKVIVTGECICDVIECLPGVWES